MNIDVSDIDLWNNFIAGNKSVLEIIYRRYYPSIFNYGIVLCNDKELVKDCIQDLFMKIYKSEKLRPTTSVQAYLLKSLKNIIIDKLATHKQTVDIDSLNLDFYVDDSELESLFSKNDNDLRLSKQLVNAYKRLNNNQQNAIYLHFIKGLTWSEMSEMLNISEHSAMNLVERAVAKIRILIEKDIC